LPRIGTNILSNLLAAAWIGALTLLITPLQIRLLGIEAFGVIGLIAVFQVAMSTLDLGLATAVTRAIARDRDTTALTTTRLAASVGTFYWIASAIVGTIIWLAADWMASAWLSSPTVDAEIIAGSLKLIAAFLALRWPVAFYGAVLAGLQRMDVLNSIKTIAFSLRLGGAILVLLWRPTLEAMLTWFVFSAAVEVLMFAIAAHRMMPTLPWRPAFHPAAIGAVWRFSASMGLIGLMSLLLTQSDRLVIGKLLDLQALGFYSLAYTVAVGGALMQTAINSAMLPAFAQASVEKSWASSRYNKASELMAFGLAPLCALLVFFGHDLLRLWVGLASADGAYAALAFLATGFFLNALVSNAYTVAVGFGRPDIPFKVNLLATLAYLPLLAALTWKAGIVGAALSWVVLNLYYFFSLLPIVHRTLLGEHTWSWLKLTVLPFVVCALLAAIGAKAMVMALGPIWLALALPLAGAAYAVLAYRRLSAEPKAALRHFLQKRTAVEKPDGKP